MQKCRFDKKISSVTLILLYLYGSLLKNLDYSRSFIQVLKCSVINSFVIDYDLACDFVYTRADLVLYVKFNLFQEFDCIWG